jgi:hypothetical protein
VPVGSAGAVHPYVALGHGDEADRQLRRCLAAAGGPTMQSTPSPHCNVEADVSGQQSSSLGQGFTWTLTFFPACSLASYGPGDSLQDQLGVVDRACHLEELASVYCRAWPPRWRCS